MKFPTEKSQCVLGVQTQSYLSPTPPHPKIKMRNLETKMSSPTSASPCDYRDQDRWEICLGFSLSPHAILYRYWIFLYLTLPTPQYPGFPHPAYLSSNPEPGYTFFLWLSRPTSCCYPNPCIAPSLGFCSQKYLYSCFPQPPFILCTPLPSWRITPPSAAWA